MVKSCGKEFIRFGEILLGDLDIVCLEIGVGRCDPLNTGAFALFEGKLESEVLDSRPWGAMEPRSC